MSGISGFRNKYDAAERLIAPRAEALVRSGEYATVVGSISGVRRAVRHGLNGVAARVWHLVNLPAGTDVHRLRVQIGALDRDVRRLALQLEQQRDARGE